MRPHHWVKNVIVFSAPIFDESYSVQMVFLGFAAFILFSLTASGFYLINDVKDIIADCNHPTKCKRPVAAGKISRKLALTTAAILIGVSIILSFLIAPLFGVTIFAYILTQIGYNIGLKKLPILDIMIVASGFVLRALGGALIADVSVSGWFMLCVGMLALFLGIEKRKAEIKILGPNQNTRDVLEVYSLPWLLRMESVVTSSAFMSYAIWALEGSDSKWMLVSLPFVIYAIFRYQYLSDQGKGETPELTLIKDKGMIITILLWLLTVFAIAAATTYQ